MASVDISQIESEQILPANRSRDVLIDTTYTRITSAGYIQMLRSLERIERYARAAFRVCAINGELASEDGPATDIGAISINSEASRGEIGCLKAAIHKGS